MTAQSRERFAATLRSERPDLGLACLLIGVEVQPDLDVDASLADIEELAADAAGDVPAGAAPYDTATGLRAALGDRAGFRGYGDDYDDLRASLLHEVLRRRRGLPILLSVVYVEVARRLGLAVAPIGVPGHFVAGVFGAERPVLLDPFAGGRLISEADLAARASDATGGPVEVGTDMLRPWSTDDVVTRVLGNIRALAAQQDLLRVRLWATDLALLVPHHALSLRRERGQVLAKMGDFGGAARDLEDYADAIEPADEDLAALARRDAKLVRSRLS